ncbi:LPXTG cell wall anchor domain-containing protein [Streptomyces sp. NPDC085481]|uniref:LPXTG cell wall anchor domain-containing protein n=1 Tax=Streptomyces sp. NPDC085481 TaxID=3365727 RepID=UPI0037D300DA
MRRSLIPAGALVAAVAGSLMLAPAASATGKPHGDNGTVKIHDAKTGEELMKNEPHVCAFYLDGFKFDSAQKVTWHIEGHAPTAGLKGTEGTLTLDGSGHGRTADISLPNGHYKLYWNFDGENGKAKQKTFWVDCEDKPGEENPGTPGTPTGTPTGTPSGTPSQTPGGTPSGTPGGSVSPTASSSEGSAAGGPAPSASESAEGGLAQTGSSAPVGVLAAVAVALAGAGAFLVSRRRKARQH